MWDEITYSFSNLNAAPLKFGNKIELISSHNLLGMCFRIHIGIKVNPCWWKGPQIRIWISNYIHGLVLGVITHPCPDLMHLDNLLNRRWSWGMNV